MKMTKTIKTAISMMALAGAMVCSTAWATGDIPVNPSGVKETTVISIEVNGQWYAPGSTVTVTSPQITWRVKATNDQIIKAGTCGHTDYYRANICTDENNCSVADSQKFDDFSVTGSGMTRNAESTISAGQFDVFISDISAGGFGINCDAHPLQINTKATGLTFVIATPANFSADARNTPKTAFSLDATITPESTDIGKTGINLYAAARLQDGTWYALNANTWQPFDGVTLPAAVSDVTLSAAGHQLLPLGPAPLDVSGLTGTEIYLGYGTSMSDIKYGKAYTIQ